ncbi:MAM and LDL-receptor class A domain-containing protein 1-like isoform X2 [Thalassophryne amazonica]|uniref:MAM and LDL-receptor class A domain-containing protein 1-like isoform X2 n=1 Tax=Thalassophryne amazonica TaxID=390379 RepID=UPI0014719458|nr:MAM and LDL-receptor class A domain-containing protein 1-like isoform X2 [Thalassophryne amazonica]
MCIRFWYWLPPDSSNDLEVLVLRSGTYYDAFWQRSGAPSSGWEVAEVTVSSPEKFHVVFKAVYAPGSTSAVQIDDYSARDGACMPRGNCDFESGGCTWVNIPKKEGDDWFLAKGGFQGPPTDHTTQTPEGRFLMSLLQPANPTSVAQVVSEWIQLKNTPSCLTLWYHMDNRESGTLRVYKRSEPLEQDMLFNTSTSKTSWTSFSQSLSLTKPFQLLIEAEAVNSGHIAVDDITVTPGLCQVNETTGGFVGCSFENGTCGWEDVSDGPFQWLRLRNGTENAGPPMDHTLGTELGWYVAVQSDRGEHIHPATLKSPTMIQASATCTLHFYYHMHGEGQLKVLLKNDFRDTTLWWLSGNQGDLWSHSVVTVGRTLHDFTIMFEGSRNFNSPGHVSIDDIDFTNCTLPEPQPSCPDNMFTCNNRVCVDHSQVCDYSDDCGDRSDENNCEQQGMAERCNFEQGLCSWAESDVDTAGTEWTRLRGQEAWPKRGPPRDHTQNSAAGHFVVPGTHLNERGQTSEMLSKTLLPSSSCTVRFFVYSMDDAASNLTIQSRIRRSGSDDTVLWLRENSESFSWQRVQLNFSSTANSKIVFCYEHGLGHRGLVALDDISFSKECVFDPQNSELPDISSTSAPHTSPTTTSTTAPTNPCKDYEFFCWRSSGEVCILKSLQCDYQPNCPQGEDEDGCGPCTFERDQCRWTESGDGPSRWHRQKASNNTKPPTDHTAGAGYYMSVILSPGEARLQSPSLPPSSPYCQMQFHFHISAVSAGSLRVLMQQAEGREAILWSRSHNTVSQWSQRLCLSARTSSRTRLCSVVWMQEV